MLVTEAGIVTFVKLQFSNASLPMEMTEFGIVTFDKSQYLKELVPNMYFTV